MTALHIIIVTYNSARHLPGLLTDLAPLMDSGEATLTAVDNGSSDDTLAILRECEHVQVLTAPDNPGYAGGINLGRSAGPAGVARLILNPDLRISADAIRALLECLSEPGVGIAVPTIQDPDGAVYPSLRREPSILRALGDAVLGARVSGRPGVLSEMVWQTDRYDAVHDVAWATGAVYAISADCDQVVGAWDSTRFFMYSEETDYCHRARAAGFAVRHVPKATAVHEGAGSGQSPGLQALMAVNRVRYFRKHHAAAAALLFRAVVVLHASLRLHQPGQRRALLSLLMPSRQALLPGGRTGN